MPSSHLQKGPSKPPTYFESIIQLRDCDAEKISEFIKSYVGSLSYPDYFVTKVVPSKTGLDIYLSSNQLAVKVASELMKRFGGHVQKSAKLYGRDRQSSKKLMRLTVSYRGLDFDVGDILALPVKRTVVKVKKLGHSIQCMDLRTGKLTGFFPNRTHYRVLEKFKTRVIREKPTVQAMHPETYQPVELKNGGAFPFRTNQEIRIVEWQGWWGVK